jgi:hypothetical protein
MKTLHRAWSDIRARRHLDAYVATAIAIIFAALGIIGDIVPDSLKWSAVFAGLGIILFRITLPARPAAPIEELLGDRTAFEDAPLPNLLRNASQLWIFAPSAINILNPQHCDAIRRVLLNKGNGDVRVAVLDPSNVDAVKLAVRQLDESLQYPAQEFEASLTASVAQLQKMAHWKTAGNFAYRFAQYNPGFSLVVINPTHADGLLILELHGYRNEAIGSRMHLTLTRKDSDRWFQYWVHQFDEIWTSSRKPVP